LPATFTVCKRVARSARQRESLSGGETGKASEKDGFTGLVEQPKKKSVEERNFGVCKRERDLEKGERERES
jgi:hypothetical protein